MRWAAFDSETWTLRLHAKDAKTGKSRVLVLEGPLRAIVERRIGQRRSDCHFIFHWNGARIREFRKTWRRACAAAGLQGRLFHDLRRTGVRNLVRAGVPQSVAMKISGHRTTSVFRRYDITSDEDLRQAIEKVSAYVDSLPTTPKVVPLAKAAEHLSDGNSDNFRTIREETHSQGVLTTRIGKWSRPGSNRRPLECHFVPRPRNTVLSSFSLCKSLQNAAQHATYTQPRHRTSSSHCFHTPA